MTSFNFKDYNFNNQNDHIKLNFYGAYGNNDCDHIFLRKNLGEICKIADEHIHAVLNKK